MNKILLLLIVNCLPPIALATGGSLLIAPSAFAAAKPEPVKHLTDEEIYRELKKFAVIFEQARANYVEEIDERKALEAAMNGMLESLDPHSSYLNKDEMKDFNDKAHGSFGGIGIQITADKGVIRIISPIDDTPADRAGLKAGDYITHIDDEQVGGLTLNQAVKKMKGRPGTSVRLTVIQSGKEPKTINLKRAVINVKSVRFSEKGEKKDIGYIRISDFGATTAKEMKDAIKSLERKKVSGYVLDLRNNPGGYLAAAINVADAFLDGGEIVSTRGRKKEDIDRTMATKGDLIGGKPIVVLINHGSASASEIVAGALQDNKRGIVMGSQSFGKGSVQQQKQLGDGTAIHLTIARYYTPSGKSIQAEGIAPDVEVLQSEVKVLEKKRDIFSERTLANALKNDGADDDKKDDDKPLSDEEKDAKDYQLNRALDMIRAMAKLAPAPEK
ncbi:MAG: S41 family peptidase [Rickettsiales bacterium]|jgi:carboxyl-terminal processing protease|nr:S41 family peptidase [Rickettsiales bacterium]